MNITTLASSQSKKHLQNSLFALPMSQQYCTIICHWYDTWWGSTVEKAITLNIHSSSHKMPLLNRHVHSKPTLGDCSFFTSSVSNSIPNDVRCAPSLKSCLKTYMFCSVYKDWSTCFEQCKQVHGLAVLLTFCQHFLFKKSIVYKSK